MLSSRIFQFGNTSLDALLVLYICIYELCGFCIAYVFVKHCMLFTCGGNKEYYYYYYYYYYDFLIFEIMFLFFKNTVKKLKFRYTFYQFLKSLQIISIKPVAFMLKLDCL